jgi:hypothetical protein
MFRLFDENLSSANYIESEKIYLIDVTVHISESDNTQGYDFKVKQGNFITHFNESVFCDDLSAEDSLKINLSNTTPFEALKKRMFDLTKDNTKLKIQGSITIKYDNQDPIKIAMNNIFVGEMNLLLENNIQQIQSNALRSYESYLDKRPCCTIL